MGCGGRKAPCTALGRSASAWLGLLVLCATACWISPGAADAWRITQKLSSSPSPPSSTPSGEQGQPQPTAVPTATKVAEKFFGAGSRDPNQNSDNQGNQKSIGTAGMLPVSRWNEEEKKDGPPKKKEGSGGGSSIVSKVVGMLTGSGKEDNSTTSDWAEKMMSPKERRKQERQEKIEYAQEQLVGEPHAFKEGVMCIGIKQRWNKNMHVIDSTKYGLFEGHIQALFEKYLQFCLEGNLHKCRRFADVAYDMEADKPQEKGANVVLLIGGTAPDEGMAMRYASMMKAVYVINLLGPRLLLGIEPFAQRDIPLPKQSEQNIIKEPDLATYPLEFGAGPGKTLNETNAISGSGSNKGASSNGESSLGEDFTKNDLVSEDSSTNENANHTTGIIGKLVGATQSLTSSKQRREVQTAQHRVLEQQQQIGGQPDAGVEELAQSLSEQPPMTPQQPNPTIVPLQPSSTQPPTVGQLAGAPAPAPAQTSPQLLVQNHIEPSQQIQSIPLPQASLPPVSPLTSGGTNPPVSMLDFQIPSSTQAAVSTVLDTLVSSGASNSTADPSLPDDEGGDDSDDKKKKGKKPNKVPCDPNYGYSVQSAIGAWDAIFSRLGKEPQREPSQPGHLWTGEARKEKQFGSKDRNVATLLIRNYDPEGLYHTTLLPALLRNFAVIEARIQWRATGSVTKCTHLVPLLKQLFEKVEQEETLAGKKPVKRWVNCAHFCDPDWEGCNLKQNEKRSIKSYPPLEPMLPETVLRRPDTTLPETPKALPY